MAADQSIMVAQLATMSPQVIRAAGAGKAYQSVAQSTAIAVQDAADTMRNVSMMSSTAFGIALAQMLATGEISPYSEIITQAQTVMTDAIANFTAVGTAAAAIVNAYPSS